MEREHCRNQDLLAIVSGANTNFDRLRYISERTEIGEKREAVISVTIPERPGSFKSFCSALGRRNITEFNYRLSGRESAYIFVGVAIEGDQQRKIFRKQLTECSFENIDLTDNELAKTHVRYMVGGRSPDVHGERLFRFWFPERPGALARFLASMS